MDKKLQQALKAAQRDPDDIEKLAALGLAYLRSQAQVEEPDVLRIAGNRWFSRTHGNTYHVAYVELNDQFVGESPQEYGYGDSYIETGLQLAIDAGAIPPRERYPSGILESLRDYEKRVGVKVIATANDVSRRRDL